MARAPVLCSANGLFLHDSLDDDDDLDDIIDRNSLLEIDINPVSQPNAEPVPPLPVDRSNCTRPRC